jgi:hypothetical protein
MKRMESALAAALVTFAVPFAATAADDAPTVDTLKQVLEKRLQSLRPTGMTERNVIFQDVRPGRPSGASWPFQVTAVVRDYGPGYPPNRFYGETCVGRMEKWPFTLAKDAFGEWQVQGRMTITDARQCKPNPAEGVSAVPLSDLGGASSAVPPTQPQAAGKEAPRPNGNAGGGTAGEVASGAYECWFSTRAQPGLNFTIEGGGRYRDVDGAAGTYSFDRATGRLAFRGGALDGQIAAYPAKATPTVSFRNAQNREIAFCENTGK